MASKRPDTTFKRLPFNFCAVSLQPFTTPVCTAEGTIFDLDNILSWLLKYSTDPVVGKKLSVDDLIRLNFARNEQGEYVDPVTFKVFTNNSHMVAIKPTGNVFSYDTVERLNIKAKLWRDLVSDEDFTKRDLITLQDPHNLEGRNLSSFKYIKDGVSTLTPTQERERSAGVNKSALGNAASVLPSPSAEPPSKPQVGKYLAPPSSKPPFTSTATTITIAKPNSPATKAEPKPPSSAPKAHHTTGLAAASLTSTGLTPHTSTTPALLSQETYLLTRAQITFPGYATINTTQGYLTLQLLQQHAPKAVWNFITLSKRNYYTNILFHRNIRNFMLQGGDPTGTGRGGESCWGKKPFQDEWVKSSLSHDKRGVLSMANKGRDTNTSQFFITYRACKHLDRKHTIFGCVPEGDEASFATLAAIESVEVEEESNRPLTDVRIEGVNVFEDPFERFLKEEEQAREKARERLEVERNGGAEDEKVTWTGKRVGGGGGETGPAVTVGKYLSGADARKVNVEEWEAAAEEPVKKKVKASGGFGNFDGW